MADNDALRQAAFHGHVHVCTWLGKRFAWTVTDARADENYALRWAACNGHLEVCFWLGDRFELTVEGEVREYDLEIRDVHNRVFYERKGISGTSHYINIDIPDGLYFVEIKSGDKRVVKRMIKHE